MARSASSTPLAISEAVNTAYQEHIKTGKPIASFVSVTGVKRSKLRRLFYQLAGGADQYRQQKPARVSTPRVTRTASGRRTAADAPTYRDEDIPFTVSARREDGWGFEDRYDQHGVQYIVAHGPDGHSYVRARPHEKADLLYISIIEGIPNVRLRRLEDSVIEKKAAKHRQKREMGIEANVARRIAKRSQRRLKKRLGRRDV